MREVINRPIAIDKLFHVINNMDAKDRESQAAFYVYHKQGGDMLEEDEEDWFLGSELSVDRANEIDLAESELEDDGFILG